MIRPRLTRPTEMVPATPPRPQYVPGRVLVRIKEDVSSELPDIKNAKREDLKSLALPETVDEPFRALRQDRAIQEVIPLFALPVKQLPKGASAAALAVRLAASVQFSESEDLRGINLLEISKSVDAATVAKQLDSSPGIEYAEPVPARWAAGTRTARKRPARRSRRRTGTGATTDPMINRQWGLRAINWFGRRWPDSSEMKVGVLDTGIDGDHPDLAFEFPYVSTGATAEDIVGHGTHVTGIIAAVTNNTTGVAGLCRCQLNVWKIFSDEPAEDGEYYVDEAMYQRALNDARTKGMQVINLSIGGTVFTKTEELLIRRLIESDCLVVAAMGNEFEQGNPVEYPAAHAGVVAVGAISETNRRARFSNTGTHISLVAPGTNILSTLPMKRSAYRNDEETEYGAWSGTSMAAPHVTGAATLLRAKAHKLKAKEVAERLKERATKLPGMGRQRKTSQLGWGLLNLSNLI